MTIATCFSLRLQVPAAAALMGLALAATAPAAVPADHLFVTSRGFVDGGTIPDAYAYRGCGPGAENRSPQITWRGKPAGTKSYALTLFDPDAPTGHGFWHWVLFNIPPDVHQIRDGAGSPNSHALPPGTVLGHVDFGMSGYGGPCPPPGDKPHHYLFTVRALDVASVPGGSANTTGPQLLAAMNGHVLAEGKVVGRFGR